jgi:hypothetical protein
MTYGVILGRPPLEIERPDRGMTVEWNYAHRQKVTPAVLARCARLSAELIAHVEAARQRLAEIEDDDEHEPCEVTE